jgi:hypothetical protein
MQYKQSAAVIKEGFIEMRYISSEHLNKNIIDMHAKYLLMKSFELVNKIKENVCFLCTNEEVSMLTGVPNKYANTQCWSYMRHFTTTKNRAILAFRELLHVNS